MLSEVDSMCKMSLSGYSIDLPASINSTDQSLSCLFEQLSWRGPYGNANVTVNTLDGTYDQPIP